MNTTHVNKHHPTIHTNLLSSPTGVPPRLAALSLAYNVCVNGALTQYASGQAVVYYASGFLRMREVWGAGAVCGAASLALWGTVGMGWWKVLGWW